MKKILLYLLLLLSGISLISCKKEDSLILRVYNWQDYIDDGTDEDGTKTQNSIPEDFEKWYFDKFNKKVKVVYHTFETNEVMLNNLKTGKTTYDLVCPSEYTIQRMIEHDMLIPFDFELKYEGTDELIMENYKYVSPYLKDIFATIKAKDENLAQYAVPYMWGTMGFIYNPEDVEEEDISSWDILWDEKYKNKATAKDSVRDTYVVGIMHLFKDELNELKNKFKKNEINAKEYNQELTEIMNRCDDDTIKKVEKELINMKNNLYGFEVDSGKSDIVTGKVAINFAWSGDAVYSMDVAEEENGVYLNYMVPFEGSNVWFDGWVMPKGANMELAQSFVNYLCGPDIASRNMNFIGYTSSCVGGEILDLINDWYGPCEPTYNPEDDFWYYDDYRLNIKGKDKEVDYNDEEMQIYFAGKPLKDILKEVIDEEGNPLSESYACNYYLRDLTYLFGKETTVRVAEEGRQFDAQYPSEDVINRCGVMRDFREQNDKVLEMWENVKIGHIPFIITIILLIVIVAFAIAVAVYNYLKKLRRIKRKIT